MKNAAPRPGHEKKFNVLPLETPTHAKEFAGGDDACQEESAM
jgi:hypothetical protein